MLRDKPFCDSYHSPFETSKVECEYEKRITKETKATLLPALAEVRGKITSIHHIKVHPNKKCLEQYKLSIETETKDTLQFIISSQTYFVDCGSLKKGDNIFGFYDPNNKTKVLDVLAFSLSGRMVKADYFDCFLTSQDNTLSLSITNNTYVVDAYGLPYCENISNKYMVVLYSNSTKSIPAITKPNVVIVLNR